MNWQQKLSAIKAASGRASLEMRAPGNWYVSAGMSIGGNGLLTGTYGNGATPEEAVEDHWRIYVDELDADRYVVCGIAENEKRLRWNGFMWADAL